MKKSVVMRVLRYTRPYRLYLIGALVSAIISITLTLTGPVYVGRAIDFIVGSGNVNFDGVLRILAVLAVIYPVSALFQWILSLFTNTLTSKTMRDIRFAVFRKIGSVPLKYVDAHPHGDIVSRMISDVDAVAEGLTQGMTQLFTGIVTIVGTLLFMLSIDLSITVIVVTLTPLSFFVATFIAKRSHSMFREQSKTQGELGGHISELVGNQKIVKAFGYEERAQASFEEINARLYHCGVCAQFYSALSNPATRFVNSVVYLSAGIAGAFSAISGGLTIGQISCFLTYANQYTKPFNEVTGVLTQIQTAFAAAQRLFDVLDEPSETQDGADALYPQDCEGNIVMKDVSFAYNPKIPLIQNLNLRVKQGDRVAIVGPTGSGKTTLVNLLMRFYDVDAGQILIDGVSIKEFRRDSLRRLFGMVLQETWLYYGTVRDNIAYAKPNATEEEIVEAAKEAHAHSFIKRLPDGYDTIISEDGGNISQGQKQLLCIARVMLVNPPILILDEATSSIDTRTEIRIQRAFTKMMQGKTSFIVAHRLSTIREADLILVLDAGNIVEQGTHDELLKQDGFYAKLYNSQFAATE